MTEPEPVYLSLGSNLGDRAANLYDSVAGIAALGPVTALSTLYESEPLYDVDQPPFLNCCVAITTRVKPQELLVRLKTIETTLLRRKDPHRPKGPRTADIDILIYGSRVVEITEPPLTIPHPGLRERAFVLKPLLEIAPEVADPRDGTPLRNALEQVEEQAVYLYRGKPLYYPRSDAGDDS